MTAPRKHVYRARSVGKGCSPAKTASARINGTKGGRPPWLRYAVSGAAGAWYVLDRHTLTRQPAASQAAARRLARAGNTGTALVPGPVPPARPARPARPAPPARSLPRCLPRRR